jgi:hypothetical protein
MGRPSGLSTSATQVTGSCGHRRIKLCYYDAARAIEARQLLPQHGTLELRFCLIGRSCHLKSEIQVRPCTIRPFHSGSPAARRPPTEELRLGVGPSGARGHGGPGFGPSRPRAFFESAKSGGLYFFGQALGLLLARMPVAWHGTRPAAARPSAGRRAPIGRCARKHFSELPSPGMPIRGPGPVPTGESQ